MGGWGEEGERLLREGGVGGGAFTSFHSGPGGGLRATAAGTTLIHATFSLTGRIMGGRTVTLGRLGSEPRASPLMAFMSFSPWEMGRG